jgi:hypothetical protein
LFFWQVFTRYYFIWWVWFFHSLKKGRIDLQLLKDTFFQWMLPF